MLHHVVLCGLLVPLQGFAVSPDDLPDIIFGSIGRTVWRDIGATAVGFRMVRIFWPALMISIAGTKRRPGELAAHVSTECTARRCRLAGLHT